MKRRYVIASVFGTFAVLSAQQAPKRPAAAKQEGKKVSSPNVIQLPFELKAEQLAGVEIFHAFYSGKTGAGKQEVTLRGDGTVHLMKTKAYNLPPETLDGKLQRMNFIRLLEVAEEVNFRGLAEDYKPTSGDPYWRRVIRLTLPDGRVHTVAVQNDLLQPEFERLAGAIRVVASMAVPEMLQHRFFPNL